MVQSQNFYDLYQSTYEKYTELYGEHVCVFLQKGSFYELYGIYDPVADRQENTVKEVADLLDLRLKVYPCGVSSTKTGYFGGVPEDSIHKWAGRLCSQGWTCILIDQVKDGDKVSHRSVSRVLSPGTHVENECADESMYVLSIWIDAKPDLASPPTIGISAIETTTAQIIHFEQEATGQLQSWHADMAAQFSSTFLAKEVIITWNGNPLFCPEEQSLRIIFEIPTRVPIYLKTTEKEPIGDHFARETYLARFFKQEGMLPLRIYTSLNDKPCAEYSLIQLFSFIENHDSRLIERLQVPYHWNPENVMCVLNHAMEQLNIRSSTDDFTVEKMMNKCFTAVGKRAFKQLIQTPYSDSETIRKSHDSITWLMAYDQRKNLEACLKSMCDIARLNRQVSRGALTHSSAYQLALTLESLLLLCRQVRSSPLYNEEVEDAISTCLENFKELFNWKLVMAYTDESDPFTNWIMPSYSQETVRAEATLHSLRKEADIFLRNFEKKALITAHTLEYKQGDNMRYLLNITKTQLKNMGPVKVEKFTYKSMSNTIKVEHEELESLNNKTASAEYKYKSALSIDLANVCAVYCKKTMAKWQVIEHWLAQADICISHVTVVQKYGLTRPELIEGTGPSLISIENLRHPLIEAMKARVKYTTHDINLEDANHGMLLYGINASGKSSLMKAIGISVVLAQCGLFVPATSMALRPFKTLATRILNHDNIRQGMSSFTVEMSELREILRIADDKTLVLGDEVCAGTESISGTSIVAATLEHLLKQGSKFVFATHLHDLMKCNELVENPSLKIFHLHVEYDSKTDSLIYHRSLKPGNGKTYYGLEVAKALHIPIGVLDRAHEIRAKLLGQDETKSRYNSSHTISSCEVCNKSIHRELEVHHIQERAAAIGSRNQDGTALNSTRNLITVCQTCHDKHHAKELDIKEVLQTSKGEVRIVSKNIIKKKTKEVKYTKEEQETILKCIKENKGLANTLIAMKLQQDYNIVMTKKDIDSFLKG
jgi:DNA mismatch repair protein MutS